MAGGNTTESRVQSNVGLRRFGNEAVSVEADLSWVLPTVATAQSGSFYREHSIMTEQARLLSDGNCRGKQNRSAQRQSVSEC